jgi:hypothetical protein
MQISRRRTLSCRRAAGQQFALFPLAAQSSRNYVYSAERPDHLMARMDRLQIRVTALEGRVKEVQPGGRTI